jgi:predicted alpha/beta superfamily hydrolase
MRATPLSCLLLAACGGAHSSPAAPTISATASARSSISAAPPAGTSAIAFGETFRLASAVLGEVRVINIYLPPGYAESARRYPVLYALDGGIGEDFLHIAGVIDVSVKNEVIRPRLVVGIENTERRRDLAGATSIEEERKIAPHAGGSDRFRRFLRDELMPEIARRYRVTDESALVGESFAGLFVLETLLQDPELFDTYISIDPSVWWNGGALVKSANARFASWTVRAKRLFVATADYRDTQVRIDELMTAFRDQKPAGLTVTYEPFPAEHHSRVFPVAEVRAYRALFAGSGP